MVSNTLRCFHMIGVAGAGMSALAQFCAQGGSKVTGSDRLFDRGTGADARHRLQTQGVEIVAQDGSGIRDGVDCVVFSSAVESDNPDLVRARAKGISILHRSDCLNEIVQAHRTVVIAGTSGKSTVTAMVWQILSAALGRVSVISGGPILELRDEGSIGNALNARSDVLVVEGDESDGTLAKYQAPYLSVLLNVSKDHKPVDELLEIFGDFLRRGVSVRVFADASNLAPFREPRFYESSSRPTEIGTFGVQRGDIRAQDIELGSWQSAFTIDGVQFRLPVPGAHNVVNAVAAVAAASGYGVSLAVAADALSTFRGVFRRLQLVGECRGVRVIDDFAHNPAKIRAAISAAQLSATRVLAIYQPHGVFPTKFLKDELVAAFSESLRPCDQLWLPDIYNVGALDTSITSSELVRGLVPLGCNAHHLPTWKPLMADVVAQSCEGDAVLVMGARDPELPTRARELLDALCASQERV
jgi:UDP-N-acetylmuramate--alanine ligase